MFTNRDDVGALVADIGSCYSRLGFAGDDCPRAYLPSWVGVCEDRPKDYQFNLNFRENMSVETFMQNGLINDWDMVEKMWDHMMKGFIHGDSAECPVLFAEKSFNTSHCRQRMCEVLFEKFQSPAVFFSKDAVLDCYSVGKTTGLVVDIGGCGTTITPVMDGWVESKGINTSPVSGRYMDSHLLTLLKRRPVTPLQMTPGVASYNNVIPQFRLKKTVVGDRVTSVTSAELKNVHPKYDAFMNLELARDIKESVSRIGDTTVSEFDPRFSNLPAQLYELPDGTVLEVGIERFLVPELLADSSSLDLNHPDIQTLGLGVNDMSLNSRNIPRLALDSVLKCDADTHASLLSNIVTAGGASSSEGVPERLRSEIEQLIFAQSVSSWKVRMTAAGNNERALSCWIGGSILASLGSFHEMWMTRAEYSEYGASLIDKKCP